MFEGDNFHRYGPRIKIREGCNMYVRPAVPHVYPLPWAGGAKYSVGELICDTWWAEGDPQEACPRTVARRQLERLETLGYKLYSGYEAEFLVVDKDDLTKPLFEEYVV